MEQEYRDLVLKIQCHRRHLKRNLNLTDAFYNDLVSKSVISAQESENLQTGGQTEDRVTKLLDVVLKKEEVEQLNGFISAIDDSGQTDIASKIRNQRVNAAGPVNAIKKVTYIIPIDIQLKIERSSTEPNVVTPVPAEVLSALKMQGRTSVTSALKFNYGLKVMNIEESPLRLIVKAIHKEKIKNVREDSENGQLGKLIWRNLSREPYFQRRSIERYWIDTVINRQETEMEEADSSMELPDEHANAHSRPPPTHNDPITPRTRSPQRPRVRLPGRIE